jgi:FkbM family methyltransferase
MQSKNSVPQHRDLIYDVGMYRGEDTDYYLKKGFRVIGFEANPELTKYCHDNFSDAVERKDLIIIDGAIVDQCSLESGQKTVKFFKNLDNPEWGTVCDDWARRNEMLGTNNETTEVGVVDFTECIRKYGIPYYMKIDIEGADTVCLKSLLGFELKPDYISVESEKVNSVRLKQEINLLEHLGYLEFKAIQQESIPNQLPPNPSREGKTMPYQFQFGSSGLFGKDLPGKWKGKKEILNEYMKIFFLYRLFGDNSILNQFMMGRKFIKMLTRLTRRNHLPGWYDTHAKHSSVKD